VSGFPVANRREGKAAESGELRAKSKLNKPNERERHKPAHTVGERGSLFGLMLEEGATQVPVTAPLERNECVCGEESDADAHPIRFNS